MKLTLEQAISLSRFNDLNHKKYGILETVHAIHDKKQEEQVTKVVFVTPEDKYYSFHIMVGQEEAVYEPWRVKRVEIKDVVWRRIEDE